MCNDDDSFYGPNWMNIASAGALAEEIADEDKERARLRRELSENEDDVRLEVLDYIGFYNADRIRLMESTGNHQSVNKS